MNEKEKIALREKQWEKAMSGDVKMLIWLGKQYLGQKESPMDMNVNELPEGFDLREIVDGEYEIRLLSATHNISLEEAEIMYQEYKAHNEISIELDRAKEQQWKAKH
tara:strand:+ start:287 stop:607 length:321 start_codon:yes stop_codon:yes gene_type:complete